MHFIFSFLLMAHASSFDAHVRGEMKLQHWARGANAQTNVATYDQAIDHAASDLGTFAQRYWVDNEFASSVDAPVIFHICGEGDVEQGYFLQDSALDFAKALGARVVFLEHRYYGQSLPFQDFSTEHLRYLTLDNVLEDLAGFQKWLSSKEGWTGKWIAVGGSYSGTLAALYRQKHPELVVGALASSAPMISGQGTDSDEAASETSSDDGGRPWTYQACTELGYWIADGPDRTSALILPSQNSCREIFPGAPSADFGRYNTEYDQPFLSLGGPSNVLFTYGGSDVWTNLGLSTQSNLNPGVEIRMIEGAGHHIDLNPSSDADSEDVRSARQVFIQRARTWLNAL